MSYWVPLLDGVAVSIFGIILTASFCDVFCTRKKGFAFCGCVAGLLLLQGALSFVWDVDFLRKIYPLITHFPLILFLFVLTKKYLWSVISVLFAYLCCQLRRWIALLIVSFMPDILLAQNIVQLIITVPLLIILLRFITPSVKKLIQQPKKQQLQFAVIPAIYYVFDYLSVVYTDILISGNLLAVEFMPFVCCFAYLVFIMHQSNQHQERLNLERQQEILALQINQSIREIDALRESQMLARHYRHDLRHHLQYLSVCIENNRIEQAQGYIADICKEIELQKVQQYCENESVNLILSAFVGRAHKHGVDIKIQGELLSAVEVSDTDLCVLFSNGLENALHACQKLTNEGVDCIIDVQFYERNKKLFLQIINPCSEDIEFKNGIPISKQQNHGIGVQSICAIVQRYGGMCSFIVQDKQFILRISL